MSLSISVHEASHAYAAFRMGDDTAALSGRLTLNPVKHIDPLGFLMFLLLGIGYAKPVPINPARFTNAKSTRQGIVVTSLSGPLSNIILGAISWFLYCLIYTVAVGFAWVSSPVIFVLLQLFSSLYVVNMWLAVFNLLPVPPLDGYKIFGALLPSDLYYKILQQERIIGLVFIIIVVFFRGALSTVLGLILVPFDFIIRQPIGWIFQQIQIALGLPPMPI
ncbi:MAG: site-2 protease family protein [Eubacteriales bacterium]|nr:site-2 protease family protein [Eubacteriales bacterium]